VAATPSLKIVKSIEWRGGTHRYSNRHHFAGGVPADDAHWATFAAAVVADEKDCFDGATTYVEAVGYLAGSDLPIWTGTLTGTGTASFSSYQLAPAQSAAIIRWSTTARSIKNHPIYLASYFHGTMVSFSGAPDALLAAQKTALEEYGQDWIDGFSDGTNTYHRAGPNGASAVGKFVDAYLSHRDFRR
jgi:hypothetical protein